MGNNLRKQIQDIVDEQSRKYPGVYKRSDCKSEEVLGFFYKAAEILIAKGVPEPLVVSIIKASSGNYLLGKKYGVTPESYAHNVWIYTLKRTEEDYEKGNQ